MLTASAVELRPQFRTFGPMPRAARTDRRGAEVRPQELVALGANWWPDLSIRSISQSVKRSPEGEFIQLSKGADRVWRSLCKHGAKV
jgi:hypothetical protein